ncbi:PREDICTED: serine carboxypeptidase-like 20 [Lupinus angustifolius]|uniref:serine carboxypeptidase-like 20 n=1 Tax=Lupinus angustifolius TaxID=3871 RepID=UPI00092FBB1A|nr:PREDICTED: serine carboxypeptidase-like 20 [Lupinus angustifolius]
MEYTNTSLYLCLILLSISLNFVLIQSAPKSSLITKLPGFNGTFPSKHYAGYITVEKKFGRNLYYYFVASEGNPSKDPVVLWLNGGPGCSSFDGFVYEHGPFNFEKPKTKGTLPKLQLNPYSWSKVSNIIYLDSPAGVGFSYSKNKTDYNAKNISGYSTGDFQTASDTHTFLLEWFKLYPEFLANPLFISGESFAGIYVPTLAHEIAKGIDNGVKPKLNFKGYMIGNAVTDYKFDSNALVPFAHGMALISDKLFEDVTRECKGDFYSRHQDNIQCQLLIETVNLAVVRLNIYDILEPCYHRSETLVNKTDLPLSFRKLGETKKPLPVRKRMFGRAWPLGAAVKDGIVPNWPKLSQGRSVLCTDDEVATEWLNNDAVRKAIHTVEKSIVGEWDLCSDTLAYNHDAGSMIEYHRNLTSKGYRALIFSGDHDLCVPYTGSQAWTRAMGYNIVDEWRPWFVEDQVAGYTIGYDKNLTFLTIKGAGHTVPEYKPKESLYFYQHFLNEITL